MQATDSQLEPRHESTVAAFALFILLVFADAGFTLLHLISVETGWLRGIGISLEADGGPSEIYQYIKEFWIIVCMVIAFVATRHRVYLSWALAVSFLLADDAGQIHENVGAWLGEHYQFAAPFGLRSKDVGELLVAGAAGLVTLVIVGAALWRGTEQCRRISRDVGMLIVALAVVGIAVDTLHVIAYYAKSLLAQVLLIVEDGGEMIVMSALTAYSFHIATHVGRTRFDLWSTVRVRLVNGNRPLSFPAASFSRRTYPPAEAARELP